MKKTGRHVLTLFILFGISCFYIGRYYKEKEVNQISRDKYSDTLQFKLGLLKDSTIEIHK